MALSEKTRSTLFQAFCGLMDEEAVGEMLAHFPARDVEEPVTREHLDRRFAELRTELHTGIAGLRDELHTEIGGLQNQITGLRGELHTGLAETRAEVAGLGTTIEASHRRLMAWLVTTIIAAVAAGVAAAGAVPG